MQDRTRTHSTAGVKPRLRNAEEEARAEQALVVPHDTHERHDRAPGDHDSGQPPARAQLLEEQIAGHLEGGVAEEENSQAEVVLVARHVQILLQALDLRVADVAAVEEGEEV